MSYRTFSPADHRSRIKLGSVVAFPSCRDNRDRSPTLSADIELDLPEGGDVLASSSSGSPSGCEPTFDHVELLSVPILASPIEWSRANSGLTDISRRQDRSDDSG